jgi:CheY-like chemotaxis protein
MTAEKILVVEDEPIVALQLKENLERLGYCVPDILESGASVVPSVARHRPDLLLVDIHLRGSDDGIDAAYRAKAEFGLPVIFLTAYSDADTLRRAALAAADGFLLKPYDERELAANVRIALTKSKSETATRRELLGAASIVEAIEDPAILADSGGYVVRANRAAAAYLGARDPGRLAGLPLSRILRPERDDLLAAGLARRAGGSCPAVSVARTDTLTLPDGRRYGELVVLGGEEMRDRKALADSSADAAAHLRSLLPGPDAAGAGYEVAGFLSPCVSGTGDFFDVFPAGSRAFAFYGFGAIGRGVLATHLALTLRELIPVVGWGAGGAAASPGDVLSALYSRYSHKGRSEGFPSFSITYGTIDSSSGAYRIVRAGHAPALRVGPDGSLRALSTEGSAVGEAPSARLEEARGELSRGDRLLVASLGLMEALGPGAGEAVEAIGTIVRSCWGKGLQELVQSIRRRAEGGGRQGRDLGLLAIERKR